VACEKNDSASKLNKLDNAYWAGFIDGEGAIGLTKKKNPKHTLGFAYVPYVSVTNTNEAILKELRKKFGGRIHMHNTEASGYPNSKQLFIWYIDSGSMVRFLLSINSHLKLKRRQAEIILDYLEKRSHYYKSYVPDVFWRIAEDAYQRLKTLNKRGKA